MPEQTIARPQPEQAEFSYEPLPQFRPSALQDDSLLADCQGKRIGILIVTYNAVTTLTKVLKRITPNVWRNVEQVVVLDDASQDATFELAVGIKALASLPKLHVLKHPKNLGYGGNQKAGYKYFLEQGLDIVVLLHGDGQYAPEILSHMYGPIVRGEADAVFGSRMMKTYGGPLKGGMPLYKYVGNRILTAFENRALGLDLTEFHSGYRAYNLHALKNIRLESMTDAFHFDTEIIIKLHHQHFTIKEVPIPTFYGDELCYVNGVRYAKDVARAVRRYISTARSVRSFPEFEEYFVPCPVKRSKYSSHHYARQFVGAGQKVLDIGRGGEDFAAELAEAGNQVARLTIDPGPGPGDWNVSGKFTRILLLDVLEHLQNPEPLLDHCRGLLEEGGFLVISVPNVANFTVRLMLLFGKFPYSDRGILDWSHVRFFTRKTVRRLAESRGYSVLTERRTIIPLERVLSFSPDGFLMKMLNRGLGALTALLPGLLAYEVMIVAQPRRTS